MSFVEFGLVHEAFLVIVSVPGGVYEELEVGKVSKVVYFTEVGSSISICHLADVILTGLVGQLVVGSQRSGTQLHR